MLIPIVYRDRMAPGETGYTLVELLAAAAIMGIVTLVAGSGLISVLQTNTRTEVRLERRQELNRALDFIADEIKEASSISHIEPTGWTDNATAAYTPLFYLQKNSPPNTVVAYYIRPKSFGGSSVVWQGPQVIYRLEQSDFTLEDVGTKGEALVDAISANPPICAAPPPPSAMTGPTPPRPGLAVLIEGGQSTKLCLAGALMDGEELVLETQAFARSQ